MFDKLTRSIYTKPPRLKTKFKDFPGFFDFYSWEVCKFKGLYSSECRETHYKKKHSSFTFTTFNNLGICDTTTS